MIRTTIALFLLLAMPMLAAAKEQETENKLLFKDFSKIRKVLPGPNDLFTMTFTKSKNNTSKEPIRIWLIKDGSRKPCKLDGNNSVSFPAKYCSPTSEVALVTNQPKGQTNVLITFSMQGKTHFDPLQIKTYKDIIRFVQDPMQTMENIAKSFPSVETDTESKDPEPTTKDLGHLQLVLPKEVADQPVVLTFPNGEIIKLYAGRNGEVTIPFCHWFEKTNPRVKIPDKAVLFF